MKIIIEPKYDNESIYDLAQSICNSHNLSVKTATVVSDSDIKDDSDHLTEPGKKIEPVGNTDLLERARQYLATIKRREHVRIMDGEPTGEYTITPAEMAVFAELVASELEEAAFESARKVYETIESTEKRPCYDYTFSDFTAYKSRKESK